MGDARVQYQLERTLPGLQLAAEYNLFDDTQRRKLTSKRRDFERGLVQRHVTSSDYLRYIQYEQDLEKLRQIRLKDALLDEDIPRQDVAKMRSEATQHIVSIYERGVQRCKYDVDLWLQYMSWAQQQKMRTAVSRISARALALFPNNIELWLAVADYELNANLSTTTARALLQQALRLNAIPHRARIEAQAAARPRPAKRARKSNGAGQGTAPPAELRVRPSGDAREDTPTLEISEMERNLVRLVIEYIRMELVFIERLRRRRAVLKILDDEEETGDAAALAETIDEKGAENIEGADSIVPSAGSDEAAAPSLAKLASETGEMKPATSGSILHGTIPAAALLSVISLDSASSLPPRTHFALLLSAGQLVRSFPFLDDATALKDHLTSQILDALEQRFPGQSSVSLYLSASATLDRANAAHIQKRIETNPEDEMERGSLLRSASKLSRKISSEAEVVYDGLHPSINSREALAAVLSVIEHNLAFLAADPVALAQAMREILVAMRARVQDLVKAKQASGAHFTAQLHATSLFVRIAKDLGPEFRAFLVAFRERILRDAEEAHISDTELKVARLATVVQESSESQSSASSSSDDEDDSDDAE